MRKVLIITYYWPPAGGPGVQRWLKFVKYLREFEIEPIVYIPEDPHYPLKDPSLVKEVPSGITIIRKKILEPYAISKLISKKETTTISSGIINEKKKQNLLQRLMLYIRGNVFIPDARVLWVKPSVKFISPFLKDQGIDTIITTGPPHSLHLIGYQLQQKLDLKWIADFRDPWTTIGYHKELKLTKRSEKKHLELEKKVLTTASHIITTSFTTAEEFRTKTSKPVTVITNGFDERGAEEVKLQKGFVISHIGSLLSGRNPENLWQVLGELISENKDFRKEFRLELTGAVSEDVISSIKKAGLEEHLQLQDYVSHEEALKLQKEATVLLLIEINSEITKGIIAGKLFEYLSAKRPILAVGPRGWDVNKILQETGAGQAFLFSNISALKEQILEYFRKYQKGELQSSAANIEQYSRKNLTRKLANLIKQEWE